MPDAADPMIQELQAKLAACASLHAYLDSMSIMAARYQVGQQWRSSIGAQAGVVIPPKITAQNPIVTANLVGAHVRQWDGRLAVSDFFAWFKPLDARPEVHLTARQLQSWYNYWLREGNLENWHNDLSFARLIIGSAIGTFYFDEDQPGGVGLAVLHPGRLTIDPANRSWDLEDHEYVIQSDAISSAEAKRRYGSYFETDEPFESDARLSNLRSTDSYVGSALYGLQPGAGDSVTTGVIVYRWFDKRYKRLRIVIQNPSPSRQKAKEKRPQFYIAKGPEQDKSWNWNWGCPYLKLDCFKNIAMAFANGIVAELVPTQNMVNLALRSKLGALLSRACYYTVAYKGTVVNEAALHGPAGSTIWLTPKAFQEKLAPQFIAPPRYDASADDLFQQSQAIMAQLSHVTPTLQGEAVKRGQAYAAYELLRRQGLVPLEEVARRDQRRTEAFLNRVARAAIDHYGRVNPGYLAKIVGRSFGSRKLGQIASRTILDGATTCVLRRSAFLAQTAQEKEAGLMAIAVGGHLPPGLDMVSELYEQTGYPRLAGQEEAYQQADELIRRILANEKDSDIYLDDNLVAIERRINRIMEQRITLELTREQIARLQQAKTECRRLAATKTAEAAAMQGLQATLAGPPGPPGEAGAPGLEAAQTAPEMGGGAELQMIGAAP